MRKYCNGHLVKTNPNKANLNFTAENAVYADKKNICVSDCSIKNYVLYRTSPRSLRTRRLMKNKAKQSQSAIGGQVSEDGKNGGNYENYPLSCFTLCHKSSTSSFIPSPVTAEIWRISFFSFFFSSLTIL